MGRRLRHAGASPARLTGTETVPAPGRCRCRHVTVQVVTCLQFPTAAAADVPADLRVRPSPSTRGLAVRPRPPRRVRRSVAHAGDADGKGLPALKWFPPGRRSSAREDGFVTRLADHFRKGEGWPRSMSSSRPFHSHEAPNAHTATASPMSNDLLGQPMSSVTPIHSSAAPMAAAQAQ